MDFNDYESAQKAMKLNGTDFGGRPIYIDLEHKKPRRGYGKEWGNEKGSRSFSRSRSRSRDKRRRSRSRSKDKLYRHTKGHDNSRDRNSNDGDFNKSSHYYDKVYNDKANDKKSASRTSSSRSSRSRSSKSRKSEDLNLQTTDMVEENKAPAFNIANSLDPRQQSMQ